MQTRRVLLLGSLVVGIELGGYDGERGRVGDGMLQPCDRERRELGLSHFIEEIDERLVGLSEDGTQQHNVLGSERPRIRFEKEGELIAQKPDRRQLEEVAAQHELNAAEAARLVEQPAADGIELVEK